SCVTLLDGFCFLCHYPPPPSIYTLSLHDALPILKTPDHGVNDAGLTTTVLPVSRAGSVLRHITFIGKFHGLITPTTPRGSYWTRSEEHTSELQSRVDLVCRLLLEKKNTMSTTSLD